MTAPRNVILQGDALTMLKTLPDECVQTVVTSPPYWGLRDYGVPGQFGLEPTLAEYVAKMVELFAEVRRVLRKDGTVWLNLGDSYAGSWGNYSPGGSMAGTPQSQRKQNGGERWERKAYGDMSMRPATTRDKSLKPKDLCGVPWRLAFALQDDGWYLRSDIIWAKPNPMPESVTDRPTRSREYIFLLAKSAHYFYDAEAIREDAPTYTRKGTAAGHHLTQMPGYKGIAGGTLKRDPDEPYGFARDITTTGRNKRSVWTVATAPFAAAHFATFPPKLIEPCILAGSRPGDIVLDPFMGSGTTAIVAVKHLREYLGCELNPDYIAMAERRLGNVQTSFLSLLDYESEAAS
jgi:DNA modification methylase